MKAAMTGYDRVNRVNHWVLAALMIGMLIMGVYVFRVLPAGPGKGALVGVHKSLGVLVLVLALVLHDPCRALPDFPPARSQSRV